MATLGEIQPYAPAKEWLRWRPGWSPGLQHDVEQGSRDARDKLCQEYSVNCPAHDSDSVEAECPEHIGLQVSKDRFAVAGKAQGAAPRVVEAQVRQHGEAVAQGCLVPRPGQCPVPLHGIQPGVVAVDVPDRNSPSTIRRTEVPKGSAGTMPQLFLPPKVLASPPVSGRVKLPQVATGSSSFRQ